MYIYFLMLYCNNFLQWYRMLYFKNWVNHMIHDTPDPPNVRGGLGFRFLLNLAIPPLLLSWQYPLFMGGFTRIVNSGNSVIFSLAFSVYHTSIAHHISNAWCELLARCAFFYYVFCICMYSMLRSETLCMLYYSSNRYN